MQRPGCRERMQRPAGCAASACGAPRAHAAPSRVRRERMQRRCSASACRASGAASACSAHAPRAHAAPSERMQRPACTQSACSVPGAPWDPDRVRLRAALVVPRWHYRTRAACSATGSTCTTSVHARQLLKAASTAHQDVLAVPGARCQRRGQLLKVSTDTRTHRTSDRPRGTRRQPLSIIARYYRSSACTAVVALQCIVTQTCMFQPSTCMLVACRTILRNFMFHVDQFRVFQLLQYPDRA